MEFPTLIISKVLRRKDWILGLAVLVTVGAIGSVGGLDHLERTAYEWGVWLSSERLPNEDIVIVAIDEPTLEKLGPWPLSRHTLAAVNQIIAQGRPKSIGYTIPFSTPENQYALELLGKLRKSHKKKFGDKGESSLNRMRYLLDTDQRLADSFAEAGSVVLAMPFYSQSQQSTSPEPLPDSLHTADVIESDQLPNDSFSPAAWFAGIFQQDHGESIDRIEFPIEPIANAAADLGLALGSASEGAVHRFDTIPLAMAFGDEFVPSFPLLLAARGKNINTNELQIEPGKGVKIGDDSIDTDSGLRVYPYFYTGDEEQPPFKVVSFSTVLERKIPAWSFQYKTVLVGLTAAELVGKVVTPIGEMMSPVMAMAHNVSSLMNGDLYFRPDWVPWAQYFAYGLIAVYLAFLLPKLRMSTGLAITGLVVVVLFNIQFVTMMTASIWMSMMAPCIALILGYLVLAGKRMVLDRVQVYQAQLSETNLLLGQSYQSQGRYDKAFVSYRKCSVSDELLAAMYHLGLDMEAKRQFGRASEVFKYIKSHDPTYKDIAARIGQNNRRLNSFAVGTGTNGGFDRTLILRDDGLQKPMLGRYQVDKELGKGDMGVVYLGRDPKIGRLVAIKTMALSEEFDEEHLPDVRARFLREAEAAGRLNHPNIVTIYDVGEEQDLAYIAMDYLRGTSMSAYARPDYLLPVEEVFNVIIQVAAALDCAHRENVVHRDIKPANIIYDREAGLATVTDFGVACLTDVSKTKSGIILGSPAFMSPEQLEGEVIDGRSDIFSLGVTFYQLLTGELPFAAHSLSSLMYKIANQQHEDVRSVRPELPECVSQIINTSLNKDTEQRFQRAELMASGVRRCMQRLVSINPPSNDVSFDRNVI